LSAAAIWQDLSGSVDTVSRGGAAKMLYYRALKADRAMLQQVLTAAPLEQTASQGARLVLPLPYGENQRFEVTLSPIMSPAMQAEYPEIKTYRVAGIDNPAISGRLDMSPLGFHAMLTTPSGTVYIDPDADGNYRSFYKKDYAAANGESAAGHVCHMAELDQPATDVAPLEQRLAQREVSTNVRRIYRLAVVMTGEYGAYFGSSFQATSSIITAINRVNQIYGRDLAIQLQLTKVLVYLDAGSDPFSNPNDLLGMLVENQQILDYRVGLDNYDVGHLFGLFGGGIALLDSVCTTSKAQGYTGHPVPDIGDPFAIDFVAHEIGHQLSATHSFNGTTENCGGGNRYAATAVEPGSGTTIMAYSGICGAENLQTNSEATFHAANIQQINTYAFSGAGSSCGSLVATGNGLPATIDAGAAVTIPAQTPFVLTGSVDADPDGDTLSYQWDQIDANGRETTDSSGANPLGADYGDNPLFRSFVPKSTATRYFPRLSTLLAGSSDAGETLPTTSRTLHFRMTVRDGNSGVGDDDVSVSVDSALGPFQISGGTLNSGTTYFDGGSTQDLTWDVNGTDVAKDTYVGCPTVWVSLLSLSNDLATYCDKDDDGYGSLLLSPTPVANNGSVTVTLPDANITNARVVLRCENNIFFALSHNNFSVISTVVNNPPVIGNGCKRVDGDSLEHGTVFVQAAIDGSNGGLSGGDGGGGTLFLLPLLLAFGGLLRRFAV
jgi:hypothetical protein